MILLSHWRQTACQFIGEAKLCNLAGKCIAPEPKALGRLYAASAGGAHGRADERALKLVRQRFPNLRLAQPKAPSSHPPHPSMRRPLHGVCYEAAQNATVRKPLPAFLS